jgi:hypothetical protein
MDDTHAWGQEETRRRGSLMTQVRASVVLDTRSGGLQMMSQGDPALILHYCSDYWDGKSIAPFTSNDRTEILSVYDRWNLEDFDVVAFAYTPISVDLRKRILQSQNIDIDGLQSKHGVRKRSATISLANSNVNVPSDTNFHDKQTTDQASPSQSTSIYIVDPYTSQDLQLMRQQYLEAINSIKVAATNGNGNGNGNGTVIADVGNLLDSPIDNLVTLDSIVNSDCNYCEPATERVFKPTTPPSTPKDGLMSSLSAFQMMNPTVLYDMQIISSQESSFAETEIVITQPSVDKKEALQTVVQEDEIEEGSELVLAIETEEEMDEAVVVAGESKEQESKSAEPLKIMSFFRGLFLIYIVNVMS